MSVLFIIRHGQASFGAADYDQLSPLGVQQALALGRYLAGRGVTLDALYTGPCLRQRDTARHLAAAARERDVHFPAPIEQAEFDEYPAVALLRHWLPRLAEREPALQPLLAPAPPADQLARAFVQIVERWARGELAAPELEDFPRFVQRVERGLDRIIAEQGRGRRIALVTSGGPVAVALRRALALDDATTLKVAWVVANSSFSEFRYRGREFTLTGFNATPHLDSADRLTHR
jgi:broad specificity phosphatase PhoE